MDEYLNLAQKSKKFKNIKILFKQVFIEDETLQIPISKK